jgi:hypothetical protein
MQSPLISIPGDDQVRLACPATTAPLALVQVQPPKVRQDDEGAS